MKILRHPLTTIADRMLWARRRRGGQCPRCGQFLLHGKCRNCPGRAAQRAKGRDRYRRLPAMTREARVAQARERARATRAQRREAGLCPACGKVPEDGLTYCTACRARAAARQRAMRVTGLRSGAAHRRLLYQALLARDGTTCPRCQQTLSLSAPVRLRYINPESTNRDRYTNVELVHETCEPAVSDEARIAALIEKGRTTYDAVRVAAQR